MIFFPGGELVKFHNFQSKKVGQIVRVTCIRRHVIFVDQSRIESADQGASILNIELHPIRFTAREQVQRRSKDEFVLG